MLYNQLFVSDPFVYQLVNNEIRRQATSLNLIASENYTSAAIREVVGSVLINKYAEGYPGKRYYAGCKYLDSIEQLAINRTKKLFSAEHVNVQPHSGSNANLAVLMASVKPGDTIISMELSHGGHLSHGASSTFIGQIYKVFFYGINNSTGLIDYDMVELLAVQKKPQLIIAGASSYCRTIDFEKFANIAKLVNAKLLIDMAHIAGLVATGLHPSPVPYADFVTFTTHKTLRGPRGGVIICKEQYAKLIDSSVFPGIQGGPLMNIIAGKAVCMLEAMQEEFKIYQKNVVNNAKILSNELIKHNFKLVSKGTDTHMLLIDLRNRQITGKIAEELLNTARITVNKNRIPFDLTPASITSGLRLGTPAITSQGINSGAMVKIAEWIAILLAPNRNSLKASNYVKKQVLNLLKEFCIR